MIPAFMRITGMILGWGGQAAETEAKHLMDEIMKDYEAGTITKDRAALPPPLVIEGACLGQALAGESMALHPGMVRVGLSQPRAQPHIGGSS